SQPGSYTISVTFDSAGGRHQSTTATATIDAPSLPAAHGQPITATAGVSSPSNLVATLPLDDAHPSMGDYTATIDWGDGSATTAGAIGAFFGPGTIFGDDPAPPVDLMVTGGHTYAE